MNFFTPITYTVPKYRYGYEDRFLLIGSCFAENIGAILKANKFSIDINPFGIQYNPLSIGKTLRLLLSGTMFTASDLFFARGLYHSFMHHGSFSAATETECLEGINSRFLKAASHLADFTVLVVTFGTAWVYRLKETGCIVSNCHKMPEKMFERERLTVSEIVGEWDEVLNGLWQRNPALKVLFTVSPVRHWKDGAHGNQLSKSTLLLAIDELRSRYADKTDYFPSYEIMMDELRDYRFYAEDMLHPSPVAVEYIWEQFSKHCLSDGTGEIMKEVKDIQKAISHRPFRPESEAYRQFMFQTLLKIERINDKFPYFDFSEEKMKVESNLK